MKTSYPKTLASAFLLVLWVTSTVWSQQAPTQEKEKPPERLIYMPFKNLDAVFEKAGGSVLVPYTDYVKLWEKAFGNGLKKSDKPPVAGVLTSADYVAKVERDIVNLTATYGVSVLDKGWAEIPIKFGEAAIGKLTSDSGNVLLRGTGNGTYSLMIPTAGDQKIVVELTARVRTAPEGKSFELEIPSVGISNIELQVPEADQSIELQPKLTTQPVDAADKTSRIKATIGSAEKISARWHARVGSKPEMDLLASVTNQTLVTVDDGLVHTDTWLTYEVLRGKLEKVKLVAPKGHRILDITSESKVKEWKAVEEENRQVVTVELLGRADGKVTLEIHTERALTGDPFDVVGIDGNTVLGVHATDVIRESGTVAVKTSPDLTLTVEDQKGLLRIDESEVDSKLKRPGASYYKFFTPSVRLRLQSKPIQPRLIVDHHSQLVFRDDQLRLRSVLNYMVDRAGVFELRFALPESIAVENVVCDRMKQFDVSTDKKTLTISLKEKTQGAIAVTVFAIRTLDPAAESSVQKLPLLEPQDVELENGKVQVYAPESIDVITDAEKVVAAQPDPAPQAEPVVNSRLVSSWLYNRRPVEIPVRTVRKPTRLTAFVGTKVDVKQGQVQVTTRLNYNVEFNGLDTFRFEVPEALADKIQIQSKAAASAPPIKQKSRAAAAVDGWVTWTVVMQRDVLGVQPFEVLYDVTPEGGAAATKQTATIDAIRVLNPYEKTEGAAGKRDVTVSRIIGEMTVVKDRALSVSTTVNGGDAEPIDVRELQFLERDGFAAFRYFKQPTRLELVSNKYEIQSVVETVVSKSLIEVVLDREGVAIHRCRYVIKSSERQRLRLDLPAKVEVLGVLVDRKPSALEKSGLPSEKGWESYYVNVARTKSTDEPFTLSVIFRHELTPKPFLNAAGPIELRLPIIGDTEKGGTAVQTMYMKVWTPPEYSLVGTPKTFSVQTKTRFREALFGASSSHFGEQNLDQWIGHDTAGIFDFPTEGKSFQYMNLGGTKRFEINWWHMPFYTLIISGALVVIALILRKTTWENKLTLIVVALFAACAYALKDHDVILHGLQAAAYGLVTGLVIWVLHGLLSQKPVTAVQAPPTSEPPPQKVDSAPPQSTPEPPPGPNENPGPHSSN